MRTTIAALGSTVQRAGLQLIKAVPRREDHLVLELGGPGGPVAGQWFSQNDRARHVYEKVGFVDEGIRREVLRVDDAWHDAHIMALLDRNWREHRGHPGGVADSPAAETS